MGWNIFFQNHWFLKKLNNEYKDLIIVLLKFRIGKLKNIISMLQE